MWTRWKNSQVVVGVICTTDGEVVLVWAAAMHAPLEGSNVYLYLPLVQLCVEG